jgi:hypothetical protein
MCAGALPPPLDSCAIAPAEPRTAHRSSPEGEHVSRSARPARTGVVAASVAAGALLLAACSPQTTTLPYAPSDGVRVDLTDTARANNLMVLSHGDGAEGAVFGALTNSSSEQVTFTLEVEGADTVSVPVDARSTVTLGGENGEELMLSAVDTIPGGYLPATLSAGDAVEEISIPVFDDTLPEYAEYVP